jgi:hypothetical protein
MFPLRGARKEELQIAHGYGQPGSADDVLSRVVTIGQGIATYSAYRYLGASTLVDENYVQAEVKPDPIHADR